MEVIQVDVVALSFVVGVVIPMIVGLVTKARASSALKAILNALLSAVAGYAIVAIKADGAIDLYAALIGIGMTWVTSVGTHTGLLKPAGVTGADGAIQRSTANVGLG